MIYRMSRDLESNLRARKYPVRVVYGPERFLGTRRDPFGIRIERDRTASEPVSTAHGFQRNPRKAMMRTLAVVAKLSATSPIPNARINEHEALCDQLVDAFLVSLQEWATAAKAGDVVVTEDRYLSDEEIDKSEHANGVVYLIRFTIQRGVVRRDFDGAALTEFAISESTDTAVRVSFDGQHYEDVS